MRQNAAPGWNACSLSSTRILSRLILLCGFSAGFCVFGEEICSLMALHFNFPEYVDDNKNPAERWITDINAELGFTEPQLNGKSLLSRPSKFGAAFGGGGEQWVISEPEIRVTDLMGMNYTPQFPSTTGSNIFGEEIEETDPRDVRAEEEWDYGRFVAEVIKEPINRFSWVVTIPPPGPWRANATRQQASQIALDIFSEQRQKSQSNLVALNAYSEILKSSNNNWIVNVIARAPLTLGQIRSHTRRHETQHVIDHMKVIRTMFGPWDRRISYLKDNNVSVIGSSQAEVISAILRARGYDSTHRSRDFTPGVRRIGAQVVEELIWSGKLYHNSTQGHPCGRSVVSYANNVLTIELSPVLLLQDQTFVTVQQLEQARSLWTWRDSYIHG